MKNRLKNRFKIKQALKSKRAVILLITMWMAVVLSMIAYTLTYELQLEVKLTKMRKDAVNASAMARAGVAKGICDLKNDLLFEYSDGMKRTIDAEGDVWKRPEEGKEDITLGKDEKAKLGFYNMKIIDDQAKIDLNLASQPVIQYALMMFDFEEEAATELSFKIVDWRDTDDDLGSNPGEPEGMYYAELLAKEEGAYFSDDLEPVRLKNDKFTTVEELLEFEEITPEIFFGIEGKKKKKREKTMSESKERYLRSDRERYIKELRKKTTEEFFDEKDPVFGLKDLFTVHSNGSLNINTATKEVLTVIAGAGAKDISEGEQIAEDIINYRRNNKKNDIDNDQAFHNTGELANAGKSANALSALGGSQKLACVSDTFVIISQGQCGDVKKTLQVRVKRDFEKFNLDDAKIKEQMEENPFPLRNFRNIKKTKEQNEGQIYHAVLRIKNWVEQ